MGCNPGEMDTAGFNKEKSLAARHENTARIVRIEGDRPYRLGGESVPGRASIERLDQAAAGSRKHQIAVVRDPGNHIGSISRTHNLLQARPRTATVQATVDAAAGSRK